MVPIRHRNRMPGCKEYSPVEFRHALLNHLSFHLLLQHRQLSRRNILSTEHMPMILVKLCSMSLFGFLSYHDSPLKRRFIWLSDFSVFPGVDLDNSDVYRDQDDR